MGLREEISQRLPLFDEDLADAVSDFSGSYVTYAGDSNIINDNARRLHHYFSLFPALIPCTSVLVVTFRRSIYVGTGPFSVLREST